jgi:hypothetical protein
MDKPIVAAINNSSISLYVLFLTVSIILIGFEGRPYNSVQSNYRCYGHGMHTMMMVLMVHIIAKNSRDNMNNENEKSYERVCVSGRVFFDRV